MRRPGVSAIELVLASAIMAAAFIPVYSLMQSNQQVAYLSEAELIARRHAQRVAASLEGVGYRILAGNATGPAPPADVRFLPPEGKRVELPLASPAEDVAREAAPAKMLDGFLRRTSSLQTQAFFHELEPGFARIAVLVTWQDPGGQKTQSEVAVGFVEDPFVWRRAQ